MCLVFAMYVRYLTLWEMLGSNVGFNKCSSLRLMRNMAWSEIMRGDTCVCMLCICFYVAPPKLDTWIYIRHFVGCAQTRVICFEVHALCLIDRKHMNQPLPSSCIRRTNNVRRVCVCVFTYALSMYICVLCSCVSLMLQVKWSSTKPKIHTSMHATWTI